MSQNRQAHVKIMQQMLQNFLSASDYFGTEVKVIVKVIVWKRLKFQMLNWFFQNKRDKVVKNGPSKIF